MTKTAQEFYKLGSQLALRKYLPKLSRKQLLALGGAGGLGILSSKLGLMDEGAALVKKLLGGTADDVAAAAAGKGVGLFQPPAPGMAALEELLPVRIPLRADLERLHTHAEAFRSAKPPSSLVDDLARIRSARDLKKELEETVRWKQYFPIFSEKPLSDHWSDSNPFNAWWDVGELYNKRAGDVYGRRKPGFSTWLSGLRHIDEVKYSPELMPSAQSFLPGPTKMLPHLNKLTDKRRFWPNPYYAF